MPFASIGYPYVEGSVEQLEKGYPAQFICEGIDQTRGWFYTLMAVGTLVFDHSSYENVVCLGHIMAEDGRKMSKHLGNIIEPIPLMEKHGSDALRWFMLYSGSPWSPRRIGEGLVPRRCAGRGLTGVSLGGDGFPSRPAPVHDGPHSAIGRIRGGKSMGGEGGMAAGGNTALQALLEEAEMSNAGLARAVVSSAAREGLHLGTSTTTVRRMLDGAQPRWPVPRLVATVLSRRLQREVGVTECGFVDREPAGEDPHDGLTCCGTLEGTVRTVVELSGRDMRRRKLLLGSVFSVAAFAEPMVVALIVPPAQGTARAAGQRVGMADVAVLTEQVAQLSKMKEQFGSGRVREQVVVLLNREANQLLHGSYSEKIGKALLSGVAQATRLAGFMAADVGRDALAQRYYAHRRPRSWSQQHRRDQGGPHPGHHGVAGPRRALAGPRPVIGPDPPRHHPSFRR